MTNALISVAIVVVILAAIVIVGELETINKRLQFILNSLNDRGYP